MRASFLLCVLLPVATASAEVQGATARAETVGPSPTSVGTMTIRTAMTATATIKLGVPIMSFAPFPPQAAYTLQPRTHLQFVADVGAKDGAVVSWYKDGKLLTTGGLTYDIAAVSATDSGSYSATAKNPDGTNAATDSAAVLISPGGQRLVNLSTRARLSENQPSILCGFVIQPGPAAAMVLVRAVGPALAAFSIPDPLAAPKLRVLDSASRELQPLYLDAIEGIFPYPSIAAATRQVGAFPLPAGGNDVAELYLLPTGVYTAEVSSADGGSGTCLAEIYEVPLGASVGPP